MAKERLVQKALGGEEDLLLGQGTVTQIRNNVVKTITKLNANSIPYSGEDAAKVSVLDKLNYIRSERVIYDYDVDGGSIGDIDLFELPDNATIIEAWYEVITAFTSGGLATLSLGVTSDDTVGLVDIAAFDNARYAAGYHGCNPSGEPAEFTTKTTAARQVIMSIATAALTAGKFYLYFNYIVSE